MVIFASDIRAATMPECGFPDAKDPVQDGQTLLTRTLRAGVAPSGNDAVEFDFNPSTTLDSQYAFGWGISQATVEPNPVAQGSTRYIRYRMRYVGTINCTGRAGGCVGGKSSIIGNTGSTTMGRIINDNGPQSCGGDPTAVEIALDRNISGGAIRIEYFHGGGILPDTWYNVQYAAISSSTNSALDGAFKLYVNNNTFASPTAESSGFAIDTAPWSEVAAGLIWGGAATFALASTGHVVLQLADFKYADTFDASWHVTSGGATGARIIIGHA